MRKLILLLAVTMVIATIVSTDASLTSAAPTTQVDAAATLDDLFAQIADSMPGFGGVFFDDEGTQSMYLVDPAQRSRAEVAVPNAECEAGPCGMPVLVIHGWEDSCAAWVGQGRLVDWLKANVPAYAECFSYEYTKGAKKAAEKLRDQIAGFKQRAGVAPEDKIDLVGFSFGGLVARHYIEKLGGNEHVSNLVMLGTPNKGAWPARLLSFWNWLRGHRDRAVSQMRPSSKFLRRLNDDFQQPTAEYFVIAGTADHAFFYWDKLAGNENDCIVKVKSARGVNFPMATAELRHEPRCGRPLVSGTPVPNMVEDKIISFQLVASGLIGTLAPEELAVQTVGQFPAEVLDSPAVGIDADTISTDEVNDHHTARVNPTAGNANFVLTWGGSSELRLSLIDPNGVEISGSGPSITYTPAYPFFNAMVESYEVEMPKAGDWTLRVEGVDAAEEEYQVVTFLEGDSLSSITTQYTETDEDSYGKDDTITISTTVVQDSKALTGAYVLANVERPDNTSQVMTLFDDGSGGDLAANDGVYTGLFSDTSQGGSYLIRTIACWPLDCQDGEFRRDDILIVDVMGSTPTPTPIPPPTPGDGPVGGSVAEIPDSVRARLEASGDSGTSVGVLAGAIAGAVLVGTVTFGGAAWYLRRRRTG